MLLQSVVTLPILLQCSYFTFYCTVYVTLPFLLHSVVTSPMLLHSVFTYVSVRCMLLYLCYCSVCYVTAQCSYFTYVTVQCSYFTSVTAV